jgi:hypothetical protein
MKEPAITVPSAHYDEATTQKVSELRHERWALMAILSVGTNTRKSNHLFSAKHMHRCEKRLIIVNEELFLLTDNPIYRVK